MKQDEPPIVKEYRGVAGGDVASGSRKLPPRRRRKIE